MPEPIVADFIIVGAGTAGCVLANRLSADPATKVLLLEAGGRAKDPWIHVPAGFYRNVANPKLTWQYETEPVPGLCGRRVAWPRGKVLGGSSTINGLIYTRGQRQDFDYWRQLGNFGWGYDDILPYFRKAEDQEHGANEFHGAGGPIRVTDPRHTHRLHHAFVAAALQSGFELNSDFNGAVQDGVGQFQVTVRGRRRCSAADGYLTPIRGRSNLRIETQATARRILFDGTRAVGLEYERNGGTARATASREVILCGGSINSPQLLQLSGVGDPDLLGQFDIPVTHALSAVGQNLQDHYGVKLVYRVKRPDTLNELSRSVVGKALAGLSYVLQKRGPLMMGAGTSALMARSREGLQSPDLQFQFLPGSLARPGAPMHDFPGCTIVCFPGRPQSRGWLKIASSDPFAHPLMQPNYLATRDDQDTIVAGLRIARKLFAAPALAEVVSAEVTPGRAIESDADLLAFAREAGGTTYHPVGTCKMGTGPGAVVGPDLKVHGLLGLRVIDASIMPAVVTNNTNAAVTMIAEKGAALILEGTRA